MKRQHATLTLIDTEDGQDFVAKVSYQPSLKNRVLNSPAANAMIRVSYMLTKAHQQFAAPIPIGEPQKKPLTFTEKLRAILPWKK